MKSPQEQAGTLSQMTVASLGNYPVSTPRPTRKQKRNFAQSGTLLIFHEGVSKESKEVMNYADLKLRYMLFYYAVLHTSQRVDVATEYIYIYIQRPQSKDTGTP